MITAYCPDYYRENILRNLVTSLQSFRDTYDLMVVSHTVIPDDIQKNINYCFYDYKNEILTDWDLLNQPWFKPIEGKFIHSSLLTKKNTHLAVWRMMILGMSIAKNLGYKKLHHIEYDCVISEQTEFDENGKLLDTYDYVVYIDNQPNVSPVLFGSFQSFSLTTVDEFLINLDEEGIKNMIRGSLRKSPELFLLNIMERKKVYKKNRDILESKGNKFGMIDGQLDFEFIPWAVPYYDMSDNKIHFVVWNTKNFYSVEHMVIVNNSRIVNIGKTELNHWKLIELGNFDDIDSIVVLENKKVRDTFELVTQEQKNIFKIMSNCRQSISE